MSRFLCFVLLFLVAFPLFAQDESIVPERRPLPRGNQAVLQRMRQQLTQELQQVQRMISAVNPNDTQFINLLQAQQTDLTKQLKDISQQLGGFSTPSDSVSDVSEGTSTALPEVPTPTKSATPATPTVRALEYAGMPVGGMPQMMPGALPPNQFPEMPALGGVGVGDMLVPAGGMPTWSADQTADSNPWAPKPSKELLEVKQTVDSMRTEIAELKETIKALETQIRLLNSNIVLSGAAKE